MFDTRLAYRNGGSCGIKQEVRILYLLKQGEVVFMCKENDLYCFSNNRFHVLYQGRDKFDFQLILSNLSHFDAAEYILEVDLYDNRQSLASARISMVFLLNITTGMFYNYDNCNDYLFGRVLTMCHGT